MKKLHVMSILALLLTIGIWACSDDNNNGGGGGGAACTTADCTCDNLCKDANFTSGDETDFGGGLVECLCAGSGDGLKKSSCETYCDQFGVSEDDSLLGMDNTANDKCACDGTS